MKQEFKQGETVYSETGQAAEYVAKIPEGHIVRPEVEAYDGDEEYTHLCAPETWSHVFSQPPTEKYSAELKALHDKIAEARAIRKKEDAEDRERIKIRAEVFKKFDALQGIEDFIAGRITHYVERESYAPPKIIAVKDAIYKEDSGWRTKLRLVTLGGELRNGEISWEISRYSDCSGAQYGVQPCTSLEQAEAIVRTAIQNHFAHSNPDARQAWIDGADKYGIAVPHEYRVKIAKSRLEQLTTPHNMSWARAQAASYTKQADDNDAEIARLRAIIAENGAK